MAPRHMPERDGDRVEFIRSFRPSGSATVVSLWDVGEGARLPMLRWGDAIYGPVYEGMKLGIEVYNGRDQMIAIPTFIEGANLWVGGPLVPEACAPSHMWEIKPYQTMRVDALMNPEGQRGRPIVITQTGFGATVGEATFGTDAFRGQLRVYERMPIVPVTAAPPAPAAYGVPSGGPSGVRSHAREAPAPMARPAPMAPRSLAYAAPSAAAEVSSLSRGQAGFGAGEEEVREHYFTGIDYHPQVAPVLFLRTEFRDDLAEMLRANLGSSWSWRWPATWGADWCNEPWMWPVPPTAPHIPVTRPRGDG